MKNMTNVKLAALLGCMVGATLTHQTGYLGGGYRSKRQKRKGERYFSVNGADRRVAKLTRNC